jgi:cell division protein FtsB
MDVIQAAVAQLQARITELEAENQALRAQVAAHA